MKPALPCRPQCECYKKPGSFMTLGPRQWIQCPNPATVTVHIVEYKGRTEVVGAKKSRCCDDCYKEFLVRAPGTRHVVKREVR